MADEPLSRRAFLTRSLHAGVGLAGVVPGVPGLWSAAPAIVTAERLRPQLPGGIQAGDVTDSRAVLWSRTDRPAELWIEWATSESFRDRRTVRGSAALGANGFTAQIDVAGLPADEQVFYRVRFESLEHPGTFSEPLVGAFRTAAARHASSARPLRIAWTGDQVGQGWGIDADRGGLRIYDAMQRAQPDVFIHSGDIIYADQPLEAEVALDDGSIWRNVVTQEKSKVAETLDEFRGNFAYNQLDAQAREFFRHVPILAQWDDHEVVNNWYPGLMLERDDRYTVKSASLLAARARQALFEYVPLRRHLDAPERIYRNFVYGDLAEVFMLDLRSYRGSNSPNTQGTLSAESALMGEEQTQWLMHALKRSQATWKIIATDMPLGLVVPDYPVDGQRTFEAWANADGGQPAGRELELARVLSFIKHNDIANCVWITADVHYAAAHHYAPERAAFVDFDPFWEFVAGPMHAGTFGPNTLDATFGPEVRFSSVGDGVTPNRPPSDGLQFFGVLDLDPQTRVLRAAIRSVAGQELWSQELVPAASG